MDLEPLDEPAHRRRQLEPAVEDDARRRREGRRPVREQQPQQDVGAVAGGDDETPLDQPLEDVGHRHGRDDEAGRLAVEQRLVTDDQLGVERAGELADGGGVEDEVGRDDVRRRTVLAREPRPDGRGGRRVDAVGDDGEDVGVVRPCLVEGHRGGDGDLLGGAAGAGDDEDHRGAEVGGERCVPGELGRRRDVGEVGPDDEHGVAAVGDGVVALDDRGHRGVGVAVHVVVPDPGGVARRQGALGQPREEQVEDVVGGRVDVADDGAEHPHPPDAPGQPVEEPEGDGGLARPSLGRGDVEARGHALTLAAAGPPAGRGRGSTR